MSEQRTGGTLDLVKPQMTEAIDKTIPDLANNMQIIDNGFGAHLAETAQQGAHNLYTTANMNIYVDQINGDDNNLGTQTLPYKTIAKAISVIPKFIWHTVNLYINNGEYPEPLVLENFIGIGYLIIRPSTNVVLTGVGRAGDFNSNTLSSMIMRNCYGNIQIVENPITFNPENLGDRHYIGLAVRHSLLSATGSSFMINVDGNNVITPGNKDGVWAVGSMLRVTQSTINNIRFGIYAMYNSQFHSQNNSGSGNNIGLLALRGSVISKEGTQLTGTTNESTQTGGVIR